MDRFLPLIEELNQGLLQIEHSQSSRIEKSSAKIKHCENMNSQLKSAFQEIDNIHPEFEIHFFKNVKPKFTVELHFQTALFEYFKSLPKGSIKEKKNYINSVLDRAASYLRRYNEFRIYLKTLATHLDEYYFRQMEFDLKVHACLEHPMDRDLTAPAGPTLTCILCAERMIKFLQLELYTLDNPNLELTWENTKRLTWNASKTDLVELIYSLYASKAVENDIKDIVSMVEGLFGVKLGNFYRIYADIKYKKNSTAFLDELKANLLDKIRSENQ
jgi:hypothetical protein